MSRPLRIAGYIGIGILTGLLVATLAILALTRTEWGMERARVFAVSWLEDRVNGELRLGRISGPGLLGGVMIHDFGIVDPDGRPFLSADSLELAYDWRTLVGGRIVLNRVVLHQPDVAIEKLPGDTVWNYERIFADTTPSDTPTQRSLILFRDAEIRGGMAAVRMALDPEDIDEPGDTARLVIEQMRGEPVRTMRFDRIDADLQRVIWESPIEEGRLFEVRSVSGRGFVWREPFLVEDARGAFTMRDSLVTFDFPEVELPASRASVLGRVIIGERNDMDIRVDSDNIRFRDLDWLHQNLPEEGGGSVTLRIRTQPEGTLYLAEDARIATPGTRVAGSFGVVVGDTMYFTEVNLRASPLDVDLIERLLPGGLPVEGLLVGTVEVSGPLSALQTRGDLRLAEAPVGEGSRLAWRGVLDVRDGRVEARTMHADIGRLDLALLTSFGGSGLPLDGNIAGRVDASGRLDRLRFTAAPEHCSLDGGRNSFDGGGTVDGRGRSRRFGVTTNAAPTTLQDLSTYVTALRGLQGELTGPVRLDGTLDDLVVDARFRTSGGTIDVNAHVAPLPRVQPAAGQRQLRTAVRLEWRFLPEYSLEAFAEDRLARAPGLGLRTEAGLRKVYGFSLFREWGF